MGLLDKEPCILSYEKHMIEANRAYWANLNVDASTQGTQEKGWIYVYHQWPGAKSSIIYEDIVAKGLQAKANYPIAALTYNADYKLINEIDSSFGIERQYHINAGERKTWVSKIRTYIAAVYFALKTYGKKERLLQMKYRSIVCGDEIHDSILQEQSKATGGKSFDCFDVGLTTYYRYIRTALSVIDQAYAVFRENKPAYFVTTEWIYINSLLESVASKMGAEILSCKPGEIEAVFHISPGKKPCIGDIIKKQIETYLENHVVDETSYENLFVLATESTHNRDLAKQLGLALDKKNVFIMLHALADAPRGVYRHNVYIEYNEWFLDTLRIIKTIPDVNWIIKDHPLSSRYLQNDYIRSVFEKNKTDNMYWCDRDVSGMQIKDIADCVVTCAGEVGLEYWAYGIPTITTSMGYFCAWGISYHMKTLEEYEYTLRNIEQLRPPTTQSMWQARRYLTAFKRIHEKVEDDLSQLFINRNRKRLDTYKSSCFGMELVDFSFFKEYTTFLKTEKIENSSIYKLENVLDVM